MYKGIVLALSACFIWGLIFVVPQYMHGFSSVEIALFRYAFYGGLSLLLLLRARLRGFCNYSLAVWSKALYLSIFSGYYLWVVLAIRYTSPEVCALILGISPITIAFYGNWKQKEGNFKLLILPSLLILIGLAMINLPHIIVNTSPFEYALGIFFSIIALASWTIYVVLNARFLKEHTFISSKDWATMQGVATFVLAIIGGVICSVLFWENWQMERYLSWNNEMQNLLLGSAILGLLCSWVGAMLWNKASLYLSVSLAGQLMIFETIFGVIFFFLLNLQVPSYIEFSGMTLLLGAVIYGIRALTPQPAAA